MPVLDTVQESNIAELGLEVQNLTTLSSVSEVGVRGIQGAQLVEGVWNLPSVVRSFVSFLRGPGIQTLGLEGAANSANAAEAANSASALGRAGTTTFGNEVHQKFESVLIEQTNTEPGDWFMRTAPGQRGVDATYVGPASRNPGFDYAELKPFGYSNTAVGNQIGRWGLPQGRTSIWWYNRSGIIGQTRGVW